ncbi:MAG: DASH family cryptochrome [Bacteroidia bacterium]|nr:DASH family cryptochrome [Bacteroidia bacterium]MDW8159486.1 DASH family cryptochrome [Bacteroidia bacterium]
MQVSPILVWFRNDLRTLDHAPLYWAAQRKIPIIALYCIDPQDFETSSIGNFPRIAGFRAQFLLESLQDLEAELKTLGGELWVELGKAEKIIPQYVEKYNIQSIYFYKAIGGYEKQIEEKVIKYLQKWPVEINSFWGHSLYMPQDLPFLLENTPDRFTDFRQTVEPGTIIHPPLSKPSAIVAFTVEENKPQQSTYKSFLSNKAQKLPYFVTSPLFRFQGGQTAALARINTYFWETQNLKNYKLTRNGLLGDNYSSQLSPYLALGCLSPRWIYAQIEEFEKKIVKNESTYWLFFELLWRDFFYFIFAKHGNRIFQAGGIKQMEIESIPNTQYFEAWIQGKTGYPLVDAAMRELANTGYISNRARQNVASFLVKNLELPWLWGASWFESLLVDYDVSSNYGNWNYIAGVGNDPRGFRYFNVTKQAEEYDPQAEYIKYWLPELQRIPVPKIYLPSQLTSLEQKKYQVEIGKTYPAPIVEFEASIKKSEINYKKAILATQGQVRNSRIRKFVKH